MKNISALIEAILFSAADPVSAEQLSAFLAVEEDEILSELNRLKEQYNRDDHGIRLVQHDTDFRFSTKPDYGEDVALFLAKKRPQLSNAALEVLSIAAYNQPVTKPYISQVRGVSSSEIVDALEEKGLLQEEGRLDLPGRPMSYVTTDKFLTVFGLDSLADMPPLTPEEQLQPEDKVSDEILLADAAVAPTESTGKDREENASSGEQE